MAAIKRILAVAVGPSRDLPIHAAVGPGVVRPYVEGLIGGLANHGHNIGTDFQIEYRERPDLDAKGGGGDTFGPCGGANFDLVFAMSTTVVRAAKASMPDTPIVCVVSDPKAEGFSRARNITGISARRSQSAGQCFESFLATVPTLKQLHVLHKKSYGPSERGLKLVKKAAKKRGVTVKSVLVKTAGDIVTKLTAMPKRDPKKPALSGVMALPVDVCLGATRQIIDLAQGQKFTPVFFPITDPVTTRPNSALAGFGVPQRRCGELMAEYVHKILWEGAAPHSLKVKDVGDDEFQWVVSSAAAQALNIKIPKVI